MATAARSEVRECATCDQSANKIAPLGRAVPTNKGALYSRNFVGDET